MTLRYLQLDVFSHRAGGGNPLAVILGAAGWSGARMQSLARWLNIVETTFVLPKTRSEADYALRIFTPLREIPYAGHPSVGSAWAAVAAGAVQPEQQKLVQECGAGLIELLLVKADSRSAAPGAIYVEAPAATVLRSGEDAKAAVADLIAPHRLGALGAMLAEGGRRWWVAELETEQDVRGYQPRFEAIAALAHASDTLGLCLFARGNSRHLVVRAFPCGVGIDEDPASGAANGLIAGIISQREPTGSLATGYRVSQGREMGHDATIDIRIEATESAAANGGSRIYVGGECHIVIDGELHWP